MTQRVRVAVVGVSGVGLGHLFAAKQLADDYELVGACDADGVAAERAAADFEAQAFDSLDALLDAGIADAVVLAVPPNLHLEMTQRSLDAGLHVFCEKPLGLTIGECDALRDAAAATDRVVQVGFQHRFQRSYATAHDMVTSGAIGEVFRVSLVSTAWFRSQHYFDERPWRGRWAAVGGGALLAQAIHHLDSLAWIVGLPERIRAEAWRTLHSADVEDEATAIAHWSNGARGTIVASTVDPAGVNRLEIHGDEGSLLLEGTGLRAARFGGSAAGIAAASTDEIPDVTVDWEEVVPDGEGDAEWFALVVETHRDFIASIREGRAPRNPPAAASDAVELTNAIYLSALRDRAVELPLDRDAYDELFAELCAGEIEVPRVDEPA